MERNSHGAMTANGTARTSPVTIADQLDVQVEQALRATRADFARARNAAAEWTPTNEV